MPLHLEAFAEGPDFPRRPIAISDGSIVFRRYPEADALPGAGKRESGFGRRLGGGQNGAAVGPDGRSMSATTAASTFVDANGGKNSWAAPRRLQGRIDPARRPRHRKVRDALRQFRGAPLMTPDDIVFDRSGGFWFTDMGLQDADGSRTGALYYASTDGRSLVRGREDPRRTASVSPDSQTVYVSDTMFRTPLGAGHRRSRQSRPGPLPMMPGRVVNSYRLPVSGQPEGRGWRAHLCGFCTLFTGRITIFDVHGGTGTWRFLIFHDQHVLRRQDMQDVWITASSSGRILKARWPRPGLKLAFNL